MTFDARALQVAASISEQRLWQRHMAISKFGATGRGGVNRQALSIAEGQARKLLLEWTGARGFKATVDPIGNLFIRREGIDQYALPVVAGSILIVNRPAAILMGFSAYSPLLRSLETIDEHRIGTQRPLELVVWTNEEGSPLSADYDGLRCIRRRPSLEKALTAKDRDGYRLPKRWPK